MSTIIAVNIKDAKKSLMDPKFILLLGDRLYNDVYTKGGEITNFKMFFDDTVNTFSIKDGNYSKQGWVNAFINWFHNFEEAVNITLLIYSGPITEELQPYQTIDNSYILGHGSIPLHGIENISDNLSIIKYDLSLTTTLEKVSGLNGKISMIKYNPESNNLDCVHNGLGLYSYLYKNEISYISNIRNTSNDFLVMSHDIDPKKLLHDGSNDKIKYVALYSGGIDILTSTHVEIIKNLNNVESLDLLYFDWGTVATNAEIIAGKSYKDYLEDDILKDRVAHTVLNVKSAFQNILNIAGLNNTRLNDIEAVGKGKEEVDEAISYVPLRNAFLINMAVTWAETMYPNEKVNFILGANLTEGLTFVDNATPFIDSINKTIKYSGQNTAYFNVIAPYKNFTKSNMLEHAKTYLGTTNYTLPLELAFSCYFPIDGEPCEKCGSCLLKNEAIVNLK